MLSRPPSSSMPPPPSSKDGYLNRVTSTATQNHNQIMMDGNGNNLNPTTSLSTSPVSTTTTAPSSSSHSASASHSSSYSTSPSVATTPSSSSMSFGLLNFDSTSSLSTSITAIVPNNTPTQPNFMLQHAARNYPDMDTATRLNQSLNGLVGKSTFRTRLNEPSPTKIIGFNLPSQINSSINQPNNHPIATYMNDQNSTSIGNVIGNVNAPILHQVDMNSYRNEAALNDMDLEE